MALQKLVDLAAASVTVSDAAPTGSTGSLWFESDTAQFFIYYDNTWVEIGGAAVESIINTINAKGDLLVGTTSAAVDNLAVGSNGQILIADSDEATGLIWRNLPPVYRNLIINGAMQIAQRSTSVPSITTTNYYTADRWKAEFSSLGTWTQSVENDAPTGSGFRKSLKMLCTTADSSPAAGDLLIVEQPIEGQNVQIIKKGTSSAEQLTLSFWVKSNVTGTYIVELFDVDNTRQVSASYSISASATWEKKTIVFPADTTGVLDNDNANSFQVNFWLGSGTTYTSGTLNTAWASVTQANRVVGQTNLASAINNYWQITGVQLEVGPVTTAYEFKPYDVELEQCRRYYYRIDADSSVSRFGIGYAYSTVNATITTFLPTPMRTAPTALEQTGTASNYAVASASGSSLVCSAVPTFATANRYVVDTTITVASGLTGGNATPMLANSTTAAWLAWSAEL